MAEACGAFDGGIGHTGNPDSWKRLLEAARRWPRPGDAIEAAVMSHLVFGPQAFHQVQAFLETRDPLLHRNPRSLAFFGPVTEPGAEDESARADVVERGDFLRYRYRVEQRRQQQHRHQFNLARFGGESRQ